jgi:hypothetical protein
MAGRVGARSRHSSRCSARVPPAATCYEPAFAAFIGPARGHPCWPSRHSPIAHETENAVHVNTALPAYAPRGVAPNRCRSVKRAAAQNHAIRSILRQPLARPGALHMRAHANAHFNAQRRLPGAGSSLQGRMGAASTRPQLAVIRPSQRRAPSPPFATAGWGAFSRKRRRSWPCARLCLCRASQCAR